ncbi:MAG: hypothetical protein ACRCX2_09725 [Paraclostridium sp.]
MKTQLIKEILNISLKRKQIEYYNYLTTLSEEQLKQELAKYNN